MLSFLGWSTVGKMPGRATENEIMEFEKKVDLAMQAEGEFEKIKGVKTIEFRKTKNGVRIWDGKSY